ncbi:hypothetical protein [Acetobacterium malicum]|uniref:hypothetical protein n=1 Tax=Acetobacterium malicum TaxID=52692 RepID=UPI0003FA3B5C|nr:hypothetical protein [Acetobacterium dehalogenans]
MFLEKEIVELFELYQDVKLLMNKDGIDYLEDMGSSNYPKIIAIGILNDLILSKKVFKRNILVGEFLKNSFNIQLSKSMLHSRTMICGKITRHILDLNDLGEVEDILNTLYGILKKLKCEENIFEKDIYDVIKGIEI